MGHMHHWMGRLQGELHPLAATLPPCLVVMVSLHECQGLVRWALMETQARLLNFSMILDMAITPTLMDTISINASIFLVFSPCMKLYIGNFDPKHIIIPLVLLHDLNLSTVFLVFLVL
jgi:hypothetical protein